MNKEVFIDLCVRMDQSDKSMAEFLLTEGIPYARFYYWKKKFLGTERVEQDNSQSVTGKKVRQSQSQITLIYPNGVRAIVELPLDADWIRTLILV